MRENYEIRKQQLENEMKMDQMINEKILAELQKAKNDEKSEREHFRREVFGYLDHLATTREHNLNIEKEKEKLIEDIRVKAAEDQWRQRCEFKQKRENVNKIARISQFEEMKRREKERIEEIDRQKRENEVFNQKESLERQKQKEAAWQQRLANHRYGCELMEQRKAEELRNLSEKQKLEESLMLIAQERERRETTGMEFVKSYQDVLPLHPNLIVIQQGKKY